MEPETHETDVITDNNYDTTKKVSKKTDSELKNRINVSSVLESKAFAMAMKVAEKYAYSKSKVYRLLQHAFEKLKDESNRKVLQDDFKHKANVLMRMAKAYYRGGYRKIPTTAVLRIVGGLLYFVWVLDFIPDFIPILGLADDLAVIVWIYNGLNSEVEDFERWEAANAMSIDNE